MFALFYSLYKAMFVGSFELFTLDQITSSTNLVQTKLVKILTSMFNNVATPLELSFSTIEYINLTSLILALITSIGIVVMAVKGIKRVFGVFFGLMR